MNDLPNIDPERFQAMASDRLSLDSAALRAPQILLLYGSLRERSYSRLVAQECERLLQAYGAQTHLFHANALPMVDSVTSDHPAVMELRNKTQWSDGMVWVSPERHGAMTGVMKSQIDWLPLSIGAVRPTQSKTLALLQVCGGSQSFNALNQMRVLGRWMRMITIPNQSSIPKAYNEFAADDRMRPSPFYNRIVDVMEELMKFTLMIQDRQNYLVDRYSERVESAEALSTRVGIPLSGHPLS